MRLFPFIRYLLPVCIAAPAQAQIGSGIIIVSQKPRADTMLYSCPTDTIRVIPEVNYPGLLYTPVSISPGTLPLPQANLSGVFKAPGVKALSVVISNNGCNSDVKTQAMACIPLPLRIVDFNAQLAGRSSGLLTWRTADEQNTDHFLVEKSSDGSSFRSLALVTATGGSRANTYQWIDGPLHEGRNYYRIRQVDRDGQEFFTEVRVLSPDPGAANTVQLYPNPTTGTLNLALSSDGNDGLTVRVLNMTGQEVTQGRYFPVTNGRNVVTITLRDALADGTYVLQYSLMRSGRSGSMRFLKIAL